MTVLPEAFVVRMARMLGEEFPQFMASYDEPRYYGLRVNTLKISVERFRQIAPFQIEPIPWTPDGFYYTEADRPGKHPYYHAGLYYIQEPSAMAPVELLDVQPGERVLDLCAAPGGKSTQIAAKLQGRGVLVANDNHAERVKALVKNIELSGVRNVVVLNEVPARIGNRFPHYFDKILIDAPCSGEGMFRKDEDMAKSWERHSVGQCVLMQRDILSHAARMLAPGGMIVYSTCTFAPEENEAMVAEFLDGHPQFHIVAVPERHGFASGRPEWIREVKAEGGSKAMAATEASTEASERMSESVSAEAVRGTVRLWPHRLRGEGHFIAVLKHEGEPEVLKSAVRNAADIGKAVHGKTHMQFAQKERRRDLKESGRKSHKGSGPQRNREYEAAGGASRKIGDSQGMDDFYVFVNAHLSRMLPDRLEAFGSHLYIMSEELELSDLSGLKVIRPGWYAGMLKKGRFEPSHALAMGLTKEEAGRIVRFTADDPRTIRYLKGETVALEEAEVVRSGRDTGAKGYCLVTVDEFPLGWGKWIDGMLKNEYPAGWRWM